MLVKKSLGEDHNFHKLIIALYLKICSLHLRIWRITNVLSRSFVEAAVLPKWKENYHFFVFNQATNKHIYQRWAEQNLPQILQKCICCVTPCHVSIETMACVCFKRNECEKRISDRQLVWLSVIYTTVRFNIWRWGWLSLRYVHRHLSSLCPASFHFHSIWAERLEDFNVYLKAMGFTDISNKRNTVLLRHCLGTEAQRIFRTLGSTETYAAEAVTLLTNHFLRANNRCFSSGISYVKGYSVPGSPIWVTWLIWGICWINATILCYRIRLYEISWLKGHCVIKSGKRTGWANIGWCSGFGNASRICFSVPSCWMLAPAPPTPQRAPLHSNSSLPTRIGRTQMHGSQCSKFIDRGTNAALIAAVTVGLAHPLQGLQTAQLEGRRAGIV